MLRIAMMMVCVLALGATPARADYCASTKNPQGCRDLLDGHLYEGMIVSKIASVRCPGFLSGAAQSVIDDYERTSPDLTGSIKSKVEQAFAQDSEKACQIAYEALGPLGYMTSWFGGPLIKLRQPPVPDGLLDGFRR